MLFKTILKRYIPSRANAPEVHDRLIALYERRVLAEEDLKEAEYDDHNAAQDELRKCIARLNTGMHIIYNEYELARTQNIHDCGEDSQNTTEVATSSSEPSPYDRPATAVFNIRGHGTHTLRNNAVSSASNHHTQAPKREEEGKFEPDVPWDQDTFRIWLSHLGTEQFQMVWATKPLRALYQFAQRWMQTDFNITVPLEDIDLLYPSDNSDALLRLPTSGVVVDIPLMEEDVVYVQVREEDFLPDRRADIHQNTPTTRRGPAFVPQRVHGDEPPFGRSADSHHDTPPPRRGQAVVPRRIHGMTRSEPPLGWCEVV
jgi:hypothetical protein